MNISEANAVNTVLDWVLGIPGVSDEPVSDEVACEWASWLADRAHQAIWAGLSGEQVRGQWPVKEEPGT